MALVVFLVYIVCLGLRLGWDHTVGYGFRWIADKIDGVAIDVGVWTIRPFDFVADVFRHVDHTISHALAVAALNCEKAAVQLWHWGGQVFWWSVHETKALALDVYHGYRDLVVSTIPNAAKWAYREALSGATRALHREEAIRHAADKRIGHVAHVAEADALRGLRVAEHALDWSEAKVGHIQREIDKLDAKVARVARKLTPAAVVALIGATIFKDFGLGWLRCNNVGRLGRAVCGMPSRVLDDLLGLLADFLIVSNLCQVIPLLEAAYEEVAAPAVHLLTEAIDAMPCAAGHQPPALTVPRLYLPAHPGFALSLP